jgi:hypothetical protein
MPTELIKMLREKRDESLAAFEEMRGFTKEARERLHESVKIYVTWQDALDVALYDAGLEPEGYAEMQKMYVTTVRGRSIRELATGMIEQLGPLSSPEIRELLESAGRHTTTNTVTATLNKRKDVFERNKDGLWVLVGGRRES